ncbi:MAG: hypothetical protein Q9225_003877 [Loekoesia sp. 1 TL-2023]
MPAKRGGGQRKGKAGKKAQIEKMIETAKKTQAAPVNHQSSTTKLGTGPQKGNYTVNGTTSQKLDNGKVNGTTSTQPVKCTSHKTATVRLPCQGFVSLQKKMPIVYTKPIPATASLPKPFKNPNHVVVRLPPKQPTKQATTFLSLPNEIRNIIYEYAMPYRKYGIQFIPRETKYEKRPAELTYYLPLAVTKSGPDLTAADGQRRRLFDLPKRLYIDQAIPPYRLSPGPAALLLVSKKVNEETSPMFYGRNTFSFHAMRPLRKFLNTLRPETRSMIRSLELIHHTAGNPGRTSDQTWKDSHDQCWHDLCFQIRDQCTGLNSLTLHLTINDLPFKMGPLAPWMNPLYAFMNLGHLKKLKIRLCQFMTEDTVLEVQAYEIRKELMGQNFYEPVTPMNEVFLDKPKPKVRPAVNSLRITGSMRVPSTEQLTQRPVHLLPRRLPLLDDPRATVFWHPPSPTDDHPLYHPAGSRGEAEAIRKLRMQKKEKSKGKATA